MAKALETGTTDLRPYMTILDLDLVRMAKMKVEDQVRAKAINDLKKSPKGGKGNKNNWFVPKESGKGGVPEDRDRSRTPYGSDKGGKGGKNTNKGGRGQSHHGGKDRGNEGRHGRV